MTSVFPIPTGRTSDTLLNTRLLAQLQSHNSNLLRIQEQISTGRRVNRPSDDPPAAIRSIALQRVREHQLQFEVNLNTTSSFLSASDSTLSRVPQIVRDVRGLVLTAISDPSGKSERDAAVSSIGNAINDIANLANTQFRDRYLFTGSNTTVQPYETKNGFVVYQGNSGSLESLVDTNFYLSSNISGDQVFGGFSTGVQSTIDFNPIVTEATKLTELNGGQGAKLTSLKITDGTNQSIVDLSNASTVGDVVRALEANPPSGRKLAVAAVNDHLEVRFDDALGGNLTISEVDGGSTANQLGILAGPGAQILGTDLNPGLTLATSLSDVLGTRSTAVLASQGNHNDIVVEALQVGTTTNGVSFQYVDDGALQAAAGLNKGNEQVVFSATPVAARAALTFTGQNNNLILTGAAAGTQLNNVEIRILNGGAIGNNAVVNFDSANSRLDISIDSTGATEIQTVINQINSNGTFVASYDSSDPTDGGLVATATIPAADIGTVTGNTTNSGGGANTVFVHVNAQQSTASDVITALQADSYVSANFQVRLDTVDATSGDNNGSGIVNVTSTTTTAGGNGTPLDLNSGLRIQLGTETHVFDVSQVKNIEDLLNVFNVSDAPLSAEINASGTGIHLKSRVSGLDFSIGENGGTTATQLGLRTFTEATPLSQLNRGRGVHTAQGTDFTIRRNDGVDLAIDVSAAKTVGDVLNIINQHASNQNPATRVIARLTATGNGIELVDDNPPTTATLTVTQEIASQAAVDLGLVPRGQLVSVPANSPLPTPATLNVNFAPPADQNNRFEITANQPGTELNGVQVQFVNSTASGNQAIVNYNSVGKILTIDVDPAATTAQTVIQQISLEGTFSAALDQQNDPSNNGNGLITFTGTIGTTSGGSSQPSAQTAAAQVAFPSPNDVNTALTVTAALGGTQFNDIGVEFRSGLTGDVANVTFDSVAQRLYVDIDPTATTATTVRDAINLEGTFVAALDTSTDTTNNGSGLIGSNLGVAATTSGGTAEILVGSDTNPQETDSVFDTLHRLANVLSVSSNVDLVEAGRLVKKLDADLDRIEFGFADVGARGRAVDAFKTQLSEEKIQVQATISEDIDVDLVEAVAQLSAQQATVEASLRMIGRSFQLSLLSFL